MRFSLSEIPYRKNVGHRKRCPSWKHRKAREMRKQPKLGEAMAWEVLANKRTGLRFRRQSLLFGWIVDFFCPEYGLVVEVDGSSHRDREQSDAERDAVMLRAGLSVLRVTNRDAIERGPQFRLAVMAGAEQIRRRNRRWTSMGLTIPT